MPDPDAVPPVRLKVRPDRTALAGVVLLLFGCLPLGLTSLLTVWIFVFPVAALVWVLRARVVAVPVGVEVCNGLGVTRVAWSDVTGVDVQPRRPLRLLLTGDRSVAMTALGRQDLSRFLAVGEAAAGRTPGTPRVPRSPR